MRLLVHDYAGHAFTIQLSRHLAGQGHEVTHVYSASFQGPKGPIARRRNDPPTLAIETMTLDQPFAKYSWMKRVRQERELGGSLARMIERWMPEAVLSIAPLDVQALAQAECRQRRIRFVFWAQDLYGIAVDRILRKKMPLVGHLVGAYYRSLEKRLLRRSDRVIAITHDFLPLLAEYGVESSRVSVIENWAPAGELSPSPRDNPWAREHDLADKLVLLYAGTLGLKHNPALLLDLARRFSDRPDVRVVVVSEGLGATWLNEHGRGLRNLVLLPFQDFAHLPDVMGTGDVLLAILDPDAGVFSVPSKILTYLCAGKPILAAIPSANLAARIIARARAGLVVDPQDLHAWLAAADRVVSDAQMRSAMGASALEYAARTFDIEAIGRHVLAALDRLVAQGLESNVAQGV